MSLFQGCPRGVPLYLLPEAENGAHAKNICKGLTIPGSWTSMTRYWGRSPVTGSLIREYTGSTPSLHTHTVQHRQFSLTKRCQKKEKKIIQASIRSQAVIFSTIKIHVIVHVHVYIRLSSLNGGTELQPGLTLFGGTEGHGKGKRTSNHRYRYIYTFPAHRWLWYKVTLSRCSLSWQ